MTLTFVLLDNIYVVYEPYAEDLGTTYQTYNQANAANYAGLAVGSILFIPFLHRYGRRPLYLASTLTQFAIALWSAYMQTVGEVIATNFLSGIGGALSETIAIVTIGDLFFVHHHALMNGIFLLMQSIGAYVGPVIMGYAADDLGWRWMWKISTILIGANFLLSLFCFEESKYIPHYSGQPAQHRDSVVSVEEAARITSDKNDTAVQTDSGKLSPSVTRTAVTYQPRSYAQRMALTTPTDEPILRHFYQPILIFFHIPGVLYCAITYGTLLAWIAMMASAISYYTVLPPYNLDPAQIGLLNLGPFVGLLIGSIAFSPLSDWSILVLARRNGGVFEPEMRLWLALPGAILCFVGTLIFGYCLGEVSAVHSPEQTAIAESTLL